LVFTAINWGLALLLLLIRKPPLRLFQTCIFTNCLIDALFVAALTILTGGFDSVLYWLFFGLIVRGAFVEPRPCFQLLLNFAASACFLAAGYGATLIEHNLGPTQHRVLELYATYGATESAVVRFLLLLVFTLCCFGVQVLLPRSAAQKDAL